MFDRRRWIAPVLVGVFSAAGPAPAQAPDRRDTARVLRDEITPELRLAVARGFQYLIGKQLPGGDFDPDVPVAANALVGLAFLAGGHSEKAGDEHAEAIRRATTALLRRQTPEGYFKDGESTMYGHGFATLYLAELYGTSQHRQTEIREALVRAIQVIEGSQGNTGGWDYGPAKRFGTQERSSGSSDTSITVCQTMALRAARNLGIAVDSGVTRQAKAYIERAQNDDGGFRYRQIGADSFFRSGSEFPRSAAGVCILYSLGDYNSQKIKLGFDYLEKSYRFPWSNHFPYYAHYYCAQAMFQAGGRSWASYFSWIRTELLKNQRSDGSWGKSVNENGTQCTAMALIILQLPYRFLPIHER